VDVQPLRSLLPALLVLAPLLAATLVRPLGRRSERLRNAFVATATGATLTGAVMLLALVARHGRVVSDLPLLLGRVDLDADAFGALFALFAAFVWFSATLASFDYLRGHEARDRYHAVSLVALSAHLGVVLAGSLLTLFVFFEVLGLVAFLLVVHVGTREAHDAGVQYLWMTVLGGVALLAGILLVHSLGGGSVGPTPAAQGLELRRGFAAGLLLLGFGVKAGMLPVHVWLPNAHPVAPTPASALLSGVMIKAGAYGIFRTIFFVMRPEGVADLADAAWRFSSQLGLVVLWIGIATMAVGVVLALGQRNAKRMLAYHSISQMGFILTGLGAGGYVAGEGGLGIAGGLLHAVNHALFKACLFLGVGAVALRTGRLDMYELGGLWRRMPVTFGLMLVPAAGIMGVPLFNGFVSKCMIHESLVEAYGVEQLASLRLAERAYLLVCAGTAASFIKLIGHVFLGSSRTHDLREVREAPVAMLIAMGLLATWVLVLGLRPDLLLGGTMLQGLERANLPAADLRHFLEDDLFSWATVSRALMAVALGVVVYWVGVKAGLFHLRLPRALALEAWYGRAGAAFLAACRTAAAAHLGLVRVLARALRRLRRRAAVGAHDLERLRWRLGDTVLAGAPGSDEQRFIENAWLALDRERHETVRGALAALARKGADPPGPAGPARESTRESVRAIAGHMAALIFAERMATLVELARAGVGGALPTAFDRVTGDLAATREAVVEAALPLAARRRAGDDIAPLVVEALGPILAREAFSARLRDAAGLPAPAAEPAPEGPGRGPRPGPASLIERRERRPHGIAGLLGWTVDLLRLAAATLRQPPTTWPYSEHPHPDPLVSSTRRRLERLVRHQGLSVAMIFLTLALLLVHVWWTSEVP
jgi:formate hydrogenlyase subunit 3/multisubunit Na+/H+ antiporter MnhD subunit